MNPIFLTNYLNEKQRNTGSLEIYYDFSGISGFFVPNRLYPNVSQFGQIIGGFTVDSAYSPGVFVSCYTESGITGSGIFDGINTLKVLNNLSGNNLSLFYNFSALSCDRSFTINSKQITIPTGKIQVLSYIESKNSNTNPFEIIFGVNDAYKLTLEFSGKVNNSDPEVYKLTEASELALQNVGAIRLNDKNIEFTYFDIIEDEINNKIINLTGSYFDQDKNIYIGNIPTGKYRNGYTGLIGVVDDFIAFDEYFDANLSAGLSKLVIKTGDGAKILNITGVAYNLIQSGYLNPTGILGTGVTGYQLVPSSETINSSCGNSCIVYVKSGITGIITGEKIEYVTVGNEQYSVIQKQIKYNLYDQDYASRFTKNYIVFTPNLDNLDLFQIQFYKDVEAKIEFPEYSILNKIYITEDDITTKNTLIFFNGVNIASGNYQVLSGSNTRFSIASYDKTAQDLVNYSLSDFSDLEFYSFYHTGAIGPEYVFVGDVNSEKYDVFLNGQKLISGFNYLISGVSSHLYLKSDLPTGTVYVAQDEFISGVTGSNIKLYNNSLIYNNERIWLNGIFQNKRENYVLTSCVNKMMQATGEIEYKSESIFSNEYYRFI